MSRNLKNREILKVGTFNGEPFDEDDLDDIANNFTKLADIHKVPLKFGHDADHRADGQPAIGWVSRVYREGQKLFADFSDVPNIVAKAIKKKLYRAVSVEVLFKVDNKGKRFGHVLDAVAILGADQPAVKGLADLDALLATRAEFSGGRRVAFTVSEGNGKRPSSKEHDMDKKEIQEMVDAAVEPLKGANVKLTKENTDLKAKLKTITDADEKRTKEDTATRILASRKAVTNLLDTAVRDNKMTPAVRETYAGQIGLADDEKVLDIDVDQVKIMCSATKGTDTDETGKDNGEKKFDDPEAELNRLTRVSQSESGEKDFLAAFSLVCAANPELHVAYLNANGEV